MCGACTVNNLQALNMARFWTTLDFDREYLWNGSCRQSENGVINHNPFYV